MASAYLTNWSLRERRCQSSKLMVHMTAMVASMQANTSARRSQLRPHHWRTKIRLDSASAAAPTE